MPRTATPAGAAAKTKKKKGHAPAHQNSFAWKHNPKSKKTARILDMPNRLVCRRCHDKIEWRKQYRKYKPRTQPGKCNECQQRNVKAAYHSICEGCTATSAKAKLVIEEAVRDAKAKAERGAELEAMRAEGAEASAEAAIAEGAAAADSPADVFIPTRACAMCVREPALPDSEDDDDRQAGIADGARRLKLREIKTIERQREREAAESKKRNKQSETPEEDDDDEQRQESDDDEEEDSNEGNSEDDLDVGFSSSVAIEDDEDDPFLKAIGGADKLLTGEAYRQKLMQNQAGNS